MDANKKKAMHIRVKSTLKNLENNNFKAVYVETKEEALTLVKSIINPTSITSHGGSMTLRDSGIEEYIEKETNFRKDYRDSYNTDYYLASVNALTEHGEIYEVDGRGNRVSAILYGPKNVILVVGINKLVSSVKDAIKRVKVEAAPANAIRLCKDTPCAKMGECVSQIVDENHLFALGCNDEECICSSATIIRRSHEKGRIIIIIVGEELGY